MCRVEEVKRKQSAIVREQVGGEFLGGKRMKQNRLKSPVAWSALAALIFFLFVVKYWAGFEIPMFDQFITLAISAALAFGILNNPESKDSF